MIRRVLKNKLVSLGYAVGFADKKTREFAFTVDFNRYTEGELYEKVKLIKYEEPTADIARYFLNINEKFQDKLIFDGKIEAVPKFSSFGSQINVVDFRLSEKLCFIGITNDCTIYIIFYSPSTSIVSRYGQRTYEEVFGEDRDAEAADYIGALTAGGRITALKAKDIIYVLLSEYIIDIIMLDDVSPVIRICDNAKKFADAITNYEYKYINRRINRIEYVEKEVETKYVGLGVRVGHISNNPYLTLDEVNDVPDFQLNKPTYAWIVDNDKNQDILLLYIANEKYNKPTYKEYLGFRDDPLLKQEIDKLTAKFSQEAGYPISKQYIYGVLKKLNKELLVAPMDFIRHNTDEPIEYIEPLRYKFTVMKNRKEFESILYNSIENNLNGRYRFRFVEKLSGIYVTIGNKLNYTDTTNRIIKKQSIADFNINFNAAVIKRETIIDERSIPQLMGYIYKDIDKMGTDMLPVPSVEVVFFFPDLTCIGKEVEMYNGTSVEEAKGDGFSAFYDIGVGASSQFSVTKPKDPNEKYITIKYVNTDGETLKENIIRDLPIGSVYVPEIIPIITDREGKEWIYDTSQTPNITLTSDNNANILEIRYLKKVCGVRINYISKVGTELSRPVVKNFQVGETFNLADYKKYVDSTGAEWNLYQSKPNKFTVSDEVNRNVLTLVYDVVKAEIYISYRTRNGVDLKPQEKFNAVANNVFKPTIPEELVDAEGCVWVVGSDSPGSIMVEEDSSNSIDLVYDPKKVKVIVQFFDEENQKVRDDVVELIQVGKEFSPEYVGDYVDIYGKWWSFTNIDRKSIKVSLNERDNIITLHYAKITSTVLISMLDERGQKIRDDLIESAQIGTKYTPAAIQEIQDTRGLYWECIDKDKSLIISQNEVQNRVSYVYKPFITTVYFQYVDEEGNELLPQKSKNVQAGSIVKPEFISEFVSQDQREWILSSNNQQEFLTKKYSEENVVKINYDKKLVDIFLSFMDIKGNLLKKMICVKAQLGSEYVGNEYERITSDNGERWMLAKTDPQRMFVREKSSFTLIYDEIKAKVIVRCVNIANNLSVIDDTVIITKLGGVFVPNIGQRILDRQKHRWKYVGEPAMSIITKENEQENIIVLKYEEDKVNVTLKYINNIAQTIHKDVVSLEQIGNEIAIKEYDKIIEEDGMGWKLKEMSRKTIIVDPDPDNNIVTSNYVPLLVDVATRYIDNDGNELIADKIDKIQVGLNFTPEVLPKITDTTGKVWIYSGIDVETIKVKDEVNKVNIKYIPLIKDVKLRYVDLKNVSVLEDRILPMQVGFIFVPQPLKRAIDSEGKFWIFQKYSKDKIRIDEDETNNVITYIYDKELVDVVIKYYTDTNVMLQKDKFLRLQIGSVFDTDPPKILEDQEKLMWIVPKDAVLKYRIAESKDDNIFNIIYEKYMVHVYDKYINDETNADVLKPAVHKYQVGSHYLRNVEETVIDEEGKHWIQAMHGDSKIFARTYKVDEIQIVADETRNVTIVKYKPKLVDVLTKFVNTEGKEIKPPVTIKVQIGSIFNGEIPDIVTDGMGTKWVFDPNSDTKVKIKEDPKENAIIFTYDEKKGKVTFKYLDKYNNEIIEEYTFLAQIGSVYIPQFDTIVTDANECVWEYSERDIEKIEVSEDDSQNVFNLVYIPLYVDVKINYIDLWDKEIAEPQIVKAQLGSVYTPVQNTDFINPDSLLFRLKSVSPKELKIKDLPIGSRETPNIFNMKYEPINSDITIIYEDLNNNSLKDEEKVHLQVGSKYLPTPPEFIRDRDGNEWHLINAKNDEVTVFENPDENILKFSYEIAIGKIITRFVSMDGITIKPEETAEMQVGKSYVPKPEPYVYDKENEKWRLVEVRPVNLKVGSLDNIVTIIYREAKVKVTLLFVNEEGNQIKAEQQVEAQIGSKFSPRLPMKVIYNENEIWRLQKYEPFEIIVSENQTDNVVKLIYSNSRVEREEKEKKQELINPFANTMTTEEIEELRKMEERAKERGINIPMGTEQKVEAPSDVSLKTEPNEEAFADVSLKTEPKEEAFSDVSLKTEPKEEAFADVPLKTEPKEEAFSDVSLKTEPKEEAFADVPLKTEPKEEAFADVPLKTEQKGEAYVDVPLKTEPKKDGIADVSIKNVDNQSTPIQETTQLAHEAEKSSQVQPTNNVELPNFEKEVEFTDPVLIALSNSMYLTNYEKVAVNELNNISDATIEGLRKVKQAFESGQEQVDLSEFEEIIRKEKEIVRAGLGNLIATDKTGAKLLRVFEAIAESESDSKLFNKIQQKKSILITDYFVEKPIDDMDKAIYICAKGKNDEQFVVINNRMREKDFKAINEAIEIKTMLCYEKLMLGNYYKARTINADNYFKDEKSRQEIGANISNIVSDMLVGQAKNILSRDGLSLAQITEVEAIIHLCNKKQVDLIKDSISKFDGKARRSAMSILKEIERRM